LAASCGGQVAPEKIGGFYGIRVETATSVFDLLAVTVGWIFFCIPPENPVRCRQ